VVAGMAAAPPYRVCARRRTGSRDDDEGVSGQPQVRPDPALELLKIYNTALPQVHGYLLSRCRDRMLAQDLTAETFLATVTAARKQPTPPITTGWLVGVARHKLAALTLRYLDGLPVAQIAEHLGRTMHATEALLVRARAAFRAAYEDPEGVR